ncbi:MAG: DUF3179 domain-containing protein [Proteobacteria bacterium]|nr:DUF3179 domain-containing protein [Pseudomonadota bacterium]
MSRKDTLTVSNNDIAKSNTLSFRFYFLSMCLMCVVAYALVMKSSVFADSELHKNIEWRKTDFSKHSVNIGEIESGGPPKDGIPAIDKPKFISINQANQWLDSQEPVIVLTLAGHARAYPLQVLIYHEIVNDELADIPVSITFCPLCNASIVFDRRVKGKVLDFGVTGKLRMSDMIMYDRQTESWWQQFTGKAIVGEYTGTVLKQIPASIVAYADFRESYPTGLVLSNKTGYSRPYGRNPYKGYDRVGNSPFLFKGETDKRLPAMERVLFVRHDKQYRLYPFGLVKELSVINDELGNLKIAIFGKHGTLSALDAEQIKKSKKIVSVTAWSRQFDDQILSFEFSGNQIRDRETGSHWNILGKATSGPYIGRQLNEVDSGVHFAFAWLAFNPDSDIYEAP